MDEQERLDQLQRDISNLERKIDYLSDPDVLNQLTYDVREQYDNLVRTLTAEINSKIFELRDIVNDLIVRKVEDLTDILNQFVGDTIEARIDAFIEEVGGLDASIPELLGNIARRLDVEELNQVLDIYNRLNNIRNQAAKIISRARAIRVPSVPGLGDLISKVIKKILADIRGGLAIEELQFERVKDSWKGPYKIKGRLSELYKKYSG